MKVAFLPLATIGLSPASSTSGRAAVAPVVPDALVPVTATDPLRGSFTVPPVTVWPPTVVIVTDGAAARAEEARTTAARAAASDDRTGRADRRVRGPNIEDSSERGRGAGPLHLTPLMVVPSIELDG